MAMTEAEQRVVDGSTWDAFCDALKEAGKIVQSEKAPKDPFNQAEGYRYLSRLLRGGLEGFGRPRRRRASTPTSIGESQIPAPSWRRIPHLRCTPSLNQESGASQRFAQGSARPGP